MHSTFYKLNEEFLIHFVCKLYGNNLQEVSNTAVTAMNGKPGDTKKRNIEIDRLSLLFQKLPMIELRKTSRSFWT